MDFGSVRALTEELARPLSHEDQTAQSMPEASPTKWHLAHTTWFFETFLLLPHQPGYQVFEPSYGYLFNSYYEALGARQPRPRRGLITRPGVAEVLEYRARVDEAMAALLDRLAPGEEPAELVELGINHEQQHQELVLMDIKHLLSANPLQPAYRPLSPPAAAPSPAAPLHWLEHPGGPVELGHAGATFAFDNEGPRHAAHLAPFSIAARPVINGEWLDFMQDGGYARPELWLSDGWAALNAGGWQAPEYWAPAGAELGRPGSDWEVFTLGGRVPVHPGEPACHVSYYEADAFARWAGARLPTEAEWEVAAGPVAAGPVAAGPVAAGPVAPCGGVLDLLRCHPRVWQPEHTSFIGDVWQWTSSSYGPYPGFRPAPGAVGEYNGKFMVSQYVLRGGSAATPPGHSRVTYRNFFPPWARWCFSGVRLARDA